MTDSPAFGFEPAMPFGGDALETGLLGPILGAQQFSGWRTEATKWHETAYLGGAISTSPTLRIKGPDASKFLSDNTVNDFSKMRPGSIRHGIVCDEQGRILQHGVIKMVGDDEFITMWLSPTLDWRWDRSNGAYDATVEDLTGQVFLFQIGGPRSLEIIEAASGEDFHNLPFTKHRESTIAGGKVSVLRLGMAGTLSYEVHGSISDAHAVYNALWEAGKPFGLIKQGRRAYMLNHTEDGFPQANYHFGYPWYEEPGFGDWLDARPGAGFYNQNPRLLGSVGNNTDVRYMTPFDTKWDDVISWGHEFTGKAALQKIAENPPRTVVTLVWNTEDVTDVYASQFRPGEPYDQMDWPHDMDFSSGTFDSNTGEFRGWAYRADWVLLDGEKIGIASGRAMSLNYHTMLSLGFIDRAAAKEGTEVIVLWGSEGKPQKEIRATIARFPYLDAPSNAAFDVDSVPRLAREQLTH
ncbi:hypothetical protein ACSBPH_01245 [Microbacterium sp. F51-2R]|uniref:hypothetical protein n=1 Tax=Microbacterium sp. F51-2R TaxID=3445777 RepID=UPI003FA01364